MGWRKHIFLLLLMGSSLIIHQSVGTKIKGFYFNKGREQVWEKPDDEFAKNSSWFWDFEKYGSCARADIPPFKMPYSYTVCFKVQHDVTDWFNIMNFMSTKSGKSVVEELKSNPFSVIKEQNLTTNMKFIGQMFGWPSTQNFIDNKGGWSYGGFWYVYGIKRWEQWCRSYDLNTGEMRFYQDGRKDQDGAVNPGEFLAALDGANQKIKEPDLVTDVLFGCVLSNDVYWYNQEFGRTRARMADINLFDRALTREEIINMTTCGGTKLVGNIINSTTPFTLLGSHVEEIEVHEEDICPVRDFSAVYFGHWDWGTWHAIPLCNKIGMQVAFVANEQDEDNIKFYFQNIRPAGGWFQSLLHWNGAAWVNRFTQETCPLEWSENYPIQGQVDARMVYFQEDNRLTIESQTGAHYEPTLCTVDEKRGNYPYRFRSYILGLCWSTLFDTTYVFDLDNQYRHIGYKGSTIEFVENGNWKFTSKNVILHGSYQPPVITSKIPASKRSLAWGTFDINLDGDVCTKGKEDKTVKITITPCKSDQFTCFDGNCVSMENRCDRISDCPDSSDEKGCKIVHIDKTTYIQEYPPITADENRDPIKIPVNISVDVLKLLDIDEVSGAFKVSFKLHSTWFEPRIVYVNLKHDQDLNTLTEQEKKDIWSPDIVFANTESQDSVVIDRKVSARIQRLGQFVTSDRTQAIKANYFWGSQNPITFSRIYDIEFICKYDMAWYPFDSQQCELRFEPFGSSGKYVRFVSDIINYNDEKDLSKYFIKDWQIYNKKTVAGEGVEVSIFLGRRLLSIMTTVFIPSFLLNIIGHITCYFKPFYFESAIAVNLTVMLVLTSMFISVVAGLPVTAYIKLIEVWLLFTLFIPFVDVLLTCAIDNMRSAIEDEREINHHGKSRKVKGDNDGAANTIQVATHGGLDQKLFSVNENVQVHAMKDYYAKLKLTKKKRRSLDRLIFFQKKVKVVIVIIFITVYWTSGLQNSS